MRDFFYTTMLIFSLVGGIYMTMLAFDHEAERYFKYERVER